MTHNVGNFGKQQKIYVRPAIRCCVTQTDKCTRGHVSCFKRHAYLLTGVVVLMILWVSMLHDNVKRAA